MALTTAAKMLSGIFVFVIMARVLGPHDFGMVIYAFTLASIFVLLIDYGFSQQLLREVGQAPEHVNQLMGRVFVAKIALSIMMFVICLIYLTFFLKDNMTVTVFLLLLISSVLASFSEFFNVGFRGVGQFSRETNIATIGSVIHFSVLCSILFINANVIWVSTGFILSRTIYLCISWFAYKRYIGQIKVEKNKQQIIKTLKTGFPYAADSGFTNFFQHIDTIIVNHYLGLAGVGLYQATTKWLHGAMQFAPILANVYLPTLAAHTGSIETNKKYALKLNIQMLIIGTCGYIFFVFAGTYLSDFIYGEKYREISSLWPVIGLLMLIKYIAASQGVILAAYGKQRTRVIGQILSLAVFTLSVIFFVPEFGLVGVLSALVLTFTSTFVFYNLCLINFEYPTGFTRYLSVITTVWFLLAVLFTLYRA